MKFIVSSLQDPNVFFEIEAKDIQEAYGVALGELGYGITLNDDEDE